MHAPFSYRLLVSIAPAFLAAANSQMSDTPCQTGPHCAFKFIAAAQAVQLV